MSHPSSNGQGHHPAPVNQAQAGLPSTEVRYAVPEFEESVDIRDYIDVVLRRKWLVLTFLVGVFITTLIVSLSMKPVFKANGGLELSPQDAKVTKFEDMVASQLQTREYIQTQVKLLQSSSLARRVVEKLNLAEHPIFNPDAEQKQQKEDLNFLQKWRKSVTETVRGWLQALKPKSDDNDKMMTVDGQDLAELQKQKAMQAWFAGNLQVQPERDTTIISLSFTSVDPILARDTINTMVQEFIGWQMDNRIDSAGSAKKQLDKQIDIARIQLEKSEAELNRFAQRAGIVSLDSKLNLIYRQLEEINRALAESQANRIAKEAIYNEAIKIGPSALPAVIQNQLIQNLREKYVETQAEYQELGDTFKDGYPKVKALKAKMLDTQKRIADEEERILNSIINEYQVAQKQEESLRKEAEEKKALAMDLNSRATQYKIREREVETNKEIYQSLLSRAKEIDANVGTDLSNIRVVDYADLPLSPYKPNIKLNLLLALVVGLMGGVGVAFFLEYLDNTVKGMDEISDRFQIPILGVVPLAKPDEINDLDKLVRLQPRSGFAEAIRTTKVSIQLCSFMEQAPKSLLITSTASGEGKSTIATNLAQAFASSDERVILIDADLRKPRLHKVFNGHGQLKGMSQLLSGLAKIDEALYKTDVPNLYFLSAGPIPPNPAELLASNRMKRLLEGLSKYFDRIVIDGPPAAGFADVLALANYVNGVVLISTLGQTHRDALRIFKKSLHNVGGNLLGGIVNKLDLSKQYGGYYYKYYKYYHSYYQPYGDKQPNLPAAEEELENEPPAEES